MTDVIASFLVGAVLFPIGIYHWKRCDVIARRLGYEMPRVIDPRFTGAFFIGLGTLCLVAAVVGLTAQVLGS